jgi:hypothetical protein
MSDRVGLDDLQKHWNVAEAEIFPLTVQAGLYAWIFPLTVQAGQIFPLSRRVYNPWLL